MRNIQITAILASLMMFMWSQQPAQAGCGAVLTSSMGTHLRMHLEKNKQHQLTSTQLADATAAKPSPPDCTEAAYERSYERISPDLKLGSYH
jgi:hypothetical protein